MKSDQNSSPKVVSDDFFQGNFPASQDSLFASFDDEFEKEFNESETR